MQIKLVGYAANLIWVHPVKVNYINTVSPYIYSHLIGGRVYAVASCFCGTDQLTSNYSIRMWRVQALWLIEMRKRTEAACYSANWIYVAVFPDCLQESNVGLAR